jgi:hypothetical protein
MRQKLFTKHSRMYTNSTLNAEDLLKLSGVKGGLIVHIGCDASELIAGEFTAFEADKKFVSGSRHAITYRNSIEFKLLGDTSVFG